MSRWQNIYNDLQKENGLLKDQIKELAGAVNAIKLQNESRLQIMFYAIQKLGGEVTVTPEELQSLEGQLLAKVNEETKEVTFYIEKGKPANEVMEEGESNADNVLRLENLREHDPDSGRLPNM
jgi:hypothetical protein